MLTAQQHWLIDLGIMRSPCAIDEPVIRKAPRRFTKSPKTSKADKARLKQAIIDHINSQRMKRITADQLYDRMIESGSLDNGKGDQISIVVFKKLYSDIMRNGEAVTPTRTAKEMISEGKTVMQIMAKTGLSRKWINELKAKRKQS
ncbi:hypothetical protein [Nitrosomonas marina]|uniref:Uncharacterized protein n=1 Tax=Nitrosomonas marina TaxID=917 RepID=A0A1H8GIT3_9PROT|nr:hypothetical protein [Nitrosomonas marina]SEN44091.1 hypothetical protein SAMN05216325_11856 [Nitrosomonas marina]